MPAELSQNIWLWVFVFLAPVIICVRSFRSSGVSLMIRTAIASFFGWPIFLLAVIRAWDLRSELLPSGASFEDRAAATADGANKIFAAFLGWIPSTLWALLILGIWLIIRVSMKTYIAPKSTTITPGQ